MKRLLLALQAEKKLILIVIVIFLLFAVMGGINTNQWEKLFDQLNIFDHFEKMASKLGKNPTWFAVFKEIFLNNLMACLTLIGLGVFFGFPTLSSIATNGLLLGYVMTVSSQKMGDSIWSIFLTKILPHGVFELPAIFIAAALGLRVGIAVYWSLLSIFRKSNRMQARSTWEGIGKRLPVLLGLIVVLLLVAASIEAVLIVSI